MGVEIPPIAVAQPSQPTIARGEEATSFDERWAAWQAKGATPILLIVAAVVLYALIGR
jgi:hypothetical protein